MKISYRVKGFIAHSMPDNWGNGCDFDKSHTIFGETEWHAATLKGLITQLCDELKAEEDDVTLDACEEPGRIDIQVYQLLPFAPHRLSDKARKEWQEGKRQVWLTGYSFYVTKQVTDFCLQDVED